MNIAIINQNGGRYLFEVPENIMLKEGECVKCDTRRGVTDGTVWADSIPVDEPAAKLIGKLLGAKFPLKSVVGKTVTSVEMFEQPKQEDKRTYKVGDKVKVVNNTCGHFAKIGDVITLKDNDVLCEENAWHFKENSGYITECDFEPYTVPEKAEPEYYSGKVVCTESADEDFTAGKVYEIKDGVLTDNDGSLRPCFGNKKITSLDDKYMATWIYKFIEFKGE